MVWPNPLPKVGLDTIFEGPRTSPFSVFAVSQCNLLLLEANELARLLEAYPAEDANIVTLALDAEYKGLLESLKMNRLESSRESRGPGELSVGSPDAKPPQAVRAPPKEQTSLSSKVELMEQSAKQLTDAVSALQVETAKVPLVLKALAERMGVDVENDKEDEGGGVAGFFGCAMPAARVTFHQ